MRQRQQWSGRGLALAAALLLSCAGLPAAALEGYSGGRLSIVSEPGADSPYVHYYIGGEEKTAAEAVWSDGGRTGKAISLSGAGDTLELEYNQLQMHTMTFSGWYYWKGNSSPDVSPDGLYQQRLFTLAHSDKLWLSVMPRARDAAKADGNGYILDGVYLSFYQGTGGEETRIEKWNPALEGKENYGLPIGEWHHVALTMDGQKIKLYIDGRLWFEEMLILGVEEMRNNMFTIGGGLWEDEPTFNGLVDDMAIYDFAMTADQIAMLHAGVDPLAEGAALPAETRPSLPTEPTVTTPAAEPSEPEEEGDGALFGLPGWTVALIGVLLAVFIGLSVLLSIYQPPRPPASAKKGSPGEKTKGEKAEVPEAANSPAQEGEDEA